MNRFRPKFFDRKKADTSANTDYRRTYEVIDVESCKSKGENEAGTHLILFCPFCTDKRGKDYYSAGRLYFDKREQKGICYQCNTAVFPENHGDGNELERDFKTAVDHARKRFTDPDEMEHPEPLELEFDNLVKEDLKYLEKRNPLLPIASDMLGLMKWSGKEQGVVTPFMLGEDIVKFQVRFVGRRQRGRAPYYTSPGPKILYSPCHSLSNFRLLRERTITLCEGTYDSIALQIIGYPNPMAVLGSTLTDYQIYLLRKFMPENMFIMMDNKSIGWNLQRQLKVKMSSVSDYIVDDFNGLDPEEYLRKTYQDESELYKNNLLMWRRGDLELV